MSAITNNGTSGRIIKAIRELNPRRTVRSAEKRFTLALVGSSPGEIAEMRGFLLGPSPSEHDFARADSMIKIYTQPISEREIQEVEKSDIIIAAEGSEPALHRLAIMFSFSPTTPEKSLSMIADGVKGNDLKYAIARTFPMFRQEIARQVISEISLENTAFVVATSLGNIIPNILEPVLGVAEAASDTVVLTANQVRLLFMISAIFGTRTGFVAQWKEITSIVAAAFGWRSLARNLVSKIPFGGGIIPKGAIAYAGTSVAGQGVVYFYSTGRHMTKYEIAKSFKKTYSEALDTVKSLVGKFIPGAPDTEPSPARGKDA